MILQNPKNHQKPKPLITCIQTPLYSFRFYSGGDFFPLFQAMTNKFQKEFILYINFLRNYIIYCHLFVVGGQTLTKPTTITKQLLLLVMVLVFWLKHVCWLEIESAFCFFSPLFIFFSVLFFRLRTFFCYAHISTNCEAFSLLTIEVSVSGRVCVSVNIAFLRESCSKRKFKMFTPTKQ